MTKEKQHLKYSTLSNFTDISLRVILSGQNKGCTVFLTNLLQFTIGKMCYTQVSQDTERILQVTFFPLHKQQEDCRNFSSGI